MDEQSALQQRVRVGRFLFRGGGLTLIAKLAAVASGLVVQILLARLIPPDELGAYFLAQSLVASFALIGQVGLPRLMVRELAKATGAGRPAHARRIFLHGIRIALITIAVASIAYAIFLGPWLGRIVFHSAHLTASSAICAAWIGAMALQNLLAESLRGLHRVGMAGFFSGATTSAMTVLALAMIWATGGSTNYDEVLAITVVANFASVALASWALRSDLAPSERHESSSPPLELRGAPALLAIAIGTNLIAQSDLWIVGAVLQDTEVGLYGAAKRLIRLVSLPMVVVSLVIPPLIADLHARGEGDLLQRAVRGTTTIAGIPSLAVLAVFGLAHDWVLTSVFGPFYADAGTVLVLLSLERVAFVWAGPCGMTLMMTGNERRMMLVTFTAGVAQVILTAIGTRLGHIEGAAWGFLFGSLAQRAALWATAWNATGIRTDVGFTGLAESARLALSVVARNRRGATVRGTHEDGSPSSQE